MNPFSKLRFVAGPFSSLIGVLKEPDEETGVRAEDLFPERDEEEEMKPGCLDMQPSTSGNLSDDMIENPAKKRKLIHQDEATFAQLVSFPFLLGLK